MQSVTIDKRDFDMKYITTAGDFVDQPGQNVNEIKVIINTSQKYQEIEGIGGSFSEIGGKALAALSNDRKNEVIKNLFNHEEGAGFTFCRMPIGSSDFGLTAYSLNDSENDFEMKDFSIDRDLTYLIPFVNAALESNSELKIHASPWSPPGWLKSNKSMTGGGSLIDAPGIYKAYALYFCKFIHEYSKKGINIDRILIQNEPDVSTIYPSCIMTEEQMIKFTVEYLYPMFKEQGISTEIWGGTFRTISGLQAHNCLRNPQFRAVIEGVGIQYSAPQHMYDLQRICRDKKMMHTESQCHDGQNSWEQSAALFYDFINYMHAGCTVYTYWNMLLNDTGMSTWGWKQNSLVSIHPETEEVIYNPDFQVMKLISSNLRPGARRIEAFCFYKKVIAFENSDGSIAVFISNLNDKTESGRMVLNGKEMDLQLPPQSINAIRL